uniref:Uncharacterized protein n=1 Tax=Tanacetum cinerariifolium TaxID=118510 RepID=A0A6L2JMU3_TANCI|nr:hypothetical protein [Tanacetum cinerariifolium]
MSSDDPILTTMRFIPQHEVVQKYGAILPDTLTNQAMKESEAYKTYYDLATRKAAPKPKYVRRSTREKTEQASKASLGKRLKAIAKKSSDEDDDEEVSISNDNDDDADDQDDDDQEDKGQDDVNEQTKSNNDGDDFVHPKFSTHDEEERLDEINEEEEVNELYKDVNVNLEGRYIEMVDTPQNNLKGTQVTEDTHVILTTVTPEAQQQSSSVSSGFISNMLNPNLDIVIDAYETDKVILDTYGDTVMIKRHRQDKDDDEEPSARSNWGSKRRRARKEPESTSKPKEKTSKSTGKSTEGSKSHQKSTDKSAQAEEPIHTAEDLEEPAP